MNMEQREVDIAEPWVSVAEISDHIGISKETVYRWLKQKDRRIPCYRVGKLWKFKVSEVDEWLKNGGSRE